jgi:hypothetical protein
MLSSLHLAMSTDIGAFNLTARKTSCDLVVMNSPVQWRSPSSMDLSGKAAPDFHFYEVRSHGMGGIGVGRQCERVSRPNFCLAFARRSTQRQPKLYITAGWVVNANHGVQDATVYLSIALTCPS